MPAVCGFRFHMPLVFCVCRGCGDFLKRFRKTLLTRVSRRATLSVLVQLIQLDEGKEGAWMISLNYRDSRPIYEQIKDGLRKLIVTGAIGTDEKLPSVRSLATQLSINPNTIQRAYNELEGVHLLRAREGELCHGRPGRRQEQAAESDGKDPGTAGRAAVSGRAAGGTAGAVGRTGRRKEEQP